MHSKTQELVKASRTKIMNTHKEKRNATFDPHAPHWTCALGDVASLVSWGGSEKAGNKERCSHTRPTVCEQGCSVVQGKIHSRWEVEVEQRQFGVQLDAPNLRRLVPVYRVKQSQIVDKSDQLSSTACDVREMEDVVEVDVVVVVVMMMSECVSEGVSNE